MSSLRNATKRRTHKERAQPTARSHLGLLEKHSDYKLRADNFHKRKDRIKALTRKAAERNEDELYTARNQSFEADDFQDVCQSSYFQDVSSARVEPNAASS
jgi:U3 small nucleolar RNA-associated protein 11